MNKSVIKRILDFTKPHSFYMVLTLFLAILSVSATLYTPKIIGYAIDLIVGKGNVNFDGVLKYVVILLFAILFASISQWLMGICTSILTYRTVNDIRVSAFSKLTNAPLKYIDTTPHGDLISRIITDADQVSDGLLQGFTQLFTGVVTIFGTIVFMLTINAKITVVVVLITPLSLFVSSYIAKHTFKMFQKQSSVRGEMTAFIEEMIGNQKVVKAFNRDKTNISKFQDINDTLKHYGTKALFYSALSNPSTRFVNGIVYTAVAIIGSFSAITGNLSIGQLSAFLTYSNQYTKPFNELSGVITELQSALASAKRLFDVIDIEIEKAENSDATVLNEVDGTVYLDRVSFSYTKDTKLIEDLNFTAKPGQRIAIVGPTGCGKTTIINLLMRFYDIDSGAILVSQNDIRDVTRRSLRSCYGMVLQDTWLFYGTIKENIAYGMPYASDDEVINAAKSAFAHSFIRRLPNGYDTIVSEDGSNISQGQKQLLCIARIMLTRPPMLILDEATSNIDTRTEINIQRAFAEMMRGRTTFIVAHRLSTIKEADCILVMDAGRIIEKGTHEELLENKGFYSELYNSQFAING